MHKFSLIILSCCLLIAILLPQATYASDFIIKYYIYSMKTEGDLDKVVRFIKGFDGVNKVETVLERHWVYIYLEDEILEDERFDIRLPLAKLGYPVDRWEVQLEKPDGQD
jgi:copper chaperone CopZ